MLMHRRLRVTHPTVHQIVWRIVWRIVWARADSITFALSCQREQYMFGIFSCELSQ